MQTDTTPMIDRLTNHNWKESPLGEMNSWSPYLKGAINVCMHSKFANMVLAGSQFLAIYNEPYSKILGAKDPTEFGAPIEKVWPELWDEIKPMLERVFYKGESFLFENRRFILNRNDPAEERFFTFSYSPIYNETNKIEGIAVSVVDTTQTVKNEELLLVLRNRQLKNLFLEAPVAMCILRGPQLIVEVANDKMLEIWGKTAKQMLDQPLFEGLADAKNQGFEELLTGVYKTGKRVVFDEIPINLLRHGKTETVVVKFVYEALREENGNVSGVMVVADEITEQVNNRKQIEENEERLRLAIEITKLGTWDYNPISGELTWSDECKKIYDFPKDAKVDFAMFSSLIYPGDKAFAESEIQKALDPTGPGNYDITYRILRFSDREIRWINATGKVFLNPSGQPDRFIGTVLDVTDRKHLEDLLRESEVRVRLAVEASHMGTFDWDIQKSTFHYSENLARMFGYQKNERLKQQNFGERIHPDDQAMRLAAHQVAFETGTLFYEARMVIPEMGIRWVRLNGKVVYDDNRKPSRMYGTTLDITDQKNYAEKLEKEVADRTAKLELQNRELEQFAYIASHDLQEPLRKIQTFSEVIQKSLHDELMVKRYFDKINNSAMRMSEMIRSVLNYSKLSNDETEMIPVDLNKIVSDVMVDFELVIQERDAEIVYDKLPSIQGNPIQISQLVANLISNALKFTEKKPVITINSKLVEKNDSTSNPAFLPEHTYTEITFTDNGIGFEQKYEALIFTIFQRLHGRQYYSGTGIGLALCRKIVENHHGYITAKSELGKGSTFYVYLPLAW